MRPAAVSSHTVPIFRCAVASAHDWIVSPGDSMEDSFEASFKINVTMRKFPTNACAFGSLLAGL